MPRDNPKGAHMVKWFLETKQYKTDNPSDKGIRVMSKMNPKNYPPDFPEDHVSFAKKQGYIKARPRPPQLPELPGLNFQTVFLKKGSQLRRFYDEKNSKIDKCEAHMLKRCSHNDISVPPLYLTAGALPVYGKHYCLFNAKQDIPLMVLDYKLIRGMMATLTDEKKDLNGMLTDRFYSGVHDWELKAIAAVHKNNRDILSDNHVISKFLENIRNLPEIDNPLGEIVNNPKLPKEWDNDAFKRNVNVWGNHYIKSTGSMQKVKSYHGKDAVLFNSLREMVSRLGCAGIWSPPKNFHEEFILFDCTGLLFDGVHEVEAVGE